MGLDLLLLAVVVMAGWEGWMVLRHGGRRRQIFALMLLVCAAAALVAFAGLRGGGEPERGAVALAWVAVGAFVFLVVVPGILRSVTRAAMRRDHVRLSAWMMSVREHLQPGMGAREERETLLAFTDLREGRSDRAVDALREARGSADGPLARRAIDEKIVHAFLLARRFAEAAAHYEKHLEAPGPVTATVLVEILRAYGELGEQVKAAALMQRIEDSSLVGEPSLVYLIARARMVFLAFVGRPAAVEAMVGKRGALASLPPSARAFWIGVARREAGDLAGARAAFAVAVSASGSDARARNLAVDELARLDRRGADAPPSPPPLAPELAVLADRVAERAAATPVAWLQGAPMPQLSGVPWHKVPVTLTLVAANAAVAIVVQLLGGPGDLSLLVELGANLPAATRAGEPWRLVTHLFLHGGALHLVLNMSGLWLLGRVVEQIHGPRRFFAIYLLAGVGGGAASLLASTGHASVGASGAVFGVLGAAIAEFAVRRRAYPEPWRRAVLNMLLFLAAAQVVIGSAVPGIDQAAHLGGLAAGLAAGALLAPRGRVGRQPFMRHVALVLGVLGFVAVLGGAAAVALTPPAATIERVGWEQGNADGWRWEQPRIWAGYAGIEVLTFVVPEAAHEDEILVRALDSLVVDVKVSARRAVSPRFVAPPGFRAREELQTVQLPVGTLQFRVAAWAMTGGGSTFGLTLLVPERQAAAVLPQVTRMLSSVRAPGAE